MSLVFVQNNMENAKFKIGDLVNKKTGYQFPGIVVAVFETTKGKIRYVIEMMGYGLLHIFNEEQVRYESDKTNYDEF